jgi:GEVED domain
MKGSTQSRSIDSFVPILLILAFGVSSLPAAQLAVNCDWQQGQLHKMHWPQLPDLSPTGTDVSLAGAALADDFLCTATGPIRTLHLWASFVDDRLPKEGPDALTVELSIYADAPADGQQTDQPGELLWSQTFGPGQYAAREVHDGPENWYDPSTESYLSDNHRKAYQFDFCVQDDPFVQQERNVYWLAVREVSPSVNYSFGWKTTSRRWHWNDRAVCLSQSQQTWSPMDYPRQHRYADAPLDLAFVITSGDDTTAQHELGDAPDASSNFPVKMLAYPTNGTASGFPTVYEAGSPPYGPMHEQPRDAFYLGTWVSLESEADLGPDDDTVNNLDPPSDTANRDAADDGLRLPVVMPHCQRSTVDYTVTMTSPLAKQVFVNLWCDWNRDGDWNDTIICADGTMLSEWAVQDERPALPGPGTYTFTSQPFTCWHPNAQDGPDPIWIRLTVSEQRWETSAGAAMVGGAGPAEGYQYGETEDYYVRPLAEPTTDRYDWGDAPGYATMLANNGARHLVAGPWLGMIEQQPDAEANGQPSLEALGDDSANSDDEDGVSIPPLIQGQSASLTLSVQGGGGIVQAWIDFDADLTWQHSEQVFDGYLPDGVHIVPFAVPENAVAGQSFARFRISRRGGLGPDGPAPDGEVEDHPVWIRMLPADLKWCQWPDCTPRGIDIRVDVNAEELRTLADDFECDSPDRLTHVRLWGSWKNDQKGRIETIRLRIHADDPVGEAGADKTNRFSKPRPEILWEMQFGPGQYEESLYNIVEIGGEWWWDPARGELIPAGDTEVWQLDIEVDPEVAFLQQGSALNRRIYWLAVEVETSTGQFGWKTRHWPEHFMDDAVWNVGDRVPRPWQELRYPEGHPCYDHQSNSIDMAFCLMYTQDGTIEPPTSRPTSVTQCPVVETMCPNTETQCPAFVTKCPPVETTCPLTTTTCPAMATRCPSVETQCPTTVTQCPTVETQCPASETKCPAMVTQCPTVETQCPTGATQCPAVETRCPATETKCPATVTQCPPVLTQCPQTSTSCQSAPTTCPAVETRCPASETKCPAVLTQCPTTQTRCPTGATQCPAVETRCPPAETKCPVTQTACQALETSCPAVETKCPVSPTQCPVVATRCPATETQCPVALTKCPPTETRCPAAETKCPALKTKCPATSTQCPVVLTQCPSGCRIMLNETTAGLLLTEPCPIVDAPCLTVADYLAVATARN